MTAPRRRWFRFSLRTLLVVMVVVGTALGWTAWKFERARMRRTVLHQYLRAGAGLDDTSPLWDPPWLWEFFGDIGYCPDIELPSDKFTEAQRQYLQSMLPEVRVTVVNRQPMRTLPAREMDAIEAQPYLWNP